MFDLFNQDSNQQTSTSNNSKNFVISIGGSVVAGEKPNSTLIAKLSQMLEELRSDGYKIVVVVGGGKMARKYIAAAKSIGANNSASDELAIKITRANAFLFLQSLENGYPKVLTDLNSAKTILEQGKIAVYGGMLPGLTTDAVAALLAEKLDAAFVNLTNVSGVYNLDPNKNKNAVRYDKLNYERLMRIIMSNDIRSPGSNVVLDSFACMILRRSKIRGLVLDGENIQNIKDAIKGYSFVGTTIEEDAATQTNEEDQPDLEEIDD